MQGPRPPYFGSKQHVFQSELAELNPADDNSNAIELPTINSSIEIDQINIVDLTDNELPQTLLDGLAIILNCETGRFTPDDIQYAKKVKDESGQLTGIRLCCTENPGWLTRGLMLSGGDGYSIEYADESNPDDLYYINFDLRTVELLPYANIIGKFQGGPIDQMTVAHFKALQQFEDNITYHPIKYEQHLKDFNRDTKTSSGPFTFVIAKFEHPHKTSREVQIASLNKLTAHIRGRFGDDLIGENRFKVKAADRAIDDTAYIKLKEEVLAQGLKINQSNSVSVSL